MLPDQTFTAEIIAILWALWWIEETKPKSTVIDSNLQRFSLRCCSLMKKHF